MSIKNPKNKRLERSSATLIALALLFLTLLPTVSASDFDNIQTYDPVTRTYKIDNLFGLGDTLAEIRLNTPLNVIIPRGYQKVAEFELYNFKKDYTDAFKNMNFYQANDLSKEISRTFDYKYLSYEWKEEKVYEVICETKFNKINGTDYEECRNVEVNTKNILKPVWIKFSDINELPNDASVTIGIFTDVKKDDYVEWIPTFFGERLTEWATWTESLNVDLEAVYLFDDNLATTNVINEVGVNGTLFGGDNTEDKSVSGKINEAFDFLGLDDNVNISRVMSGHAEIWTISMWFKLEDEPTGAERLIAHYGGGGAGERFTVGWNSNDDLFIQHGTNFSLLYIQTDVDNDWNNMILVTNGTHFQSWYNGAKTLDFASTMVDDPGVETWIGSVDDNEQYYDGLIDQTLIWSRALLVSEIAEVYNEGAGLPFNVSSTPPNITLNSPTSANYTTAQTPQINFTAWDDTNLTDVKLYVNDVLNQTNATGINNTDYLFDLSLADGDYTIYGRATDDASQETNSSSIRIVIDTIDPTFIITSPVDDIITTTLPVNASLNVTTTDTNLDTCWYFTSDNSTNITYACNTETNISFSTGGNKTIYIFANDTLGNENSAETTFLINYIQESATYNATVIETESHIIILNITASEITTFNGTLTYNGTNYTVTATDDGTTGLLTRSLTVPLLSANEIVYFNWTYTLDGIDYISSNYNQTLLYITPINITSASCDDKTLRFDIQDETNLTALNGEMEYNFKYGLSNDTLKEIYGSITNTTTFYICINASVSETYNIGYGEIQYRDAGYVDRRYYLFEGRAISNNTLANITLRDLPTADQTSFLLTMEDTSLNVYAEKYTALWRWYPDLNEYQIVEMGKTDESGQTVAHVDVEDVDYRVGLYETDGTLIKLGDPLRFVCSSSPCSFTLRVGGTSIDYSSIYDVQADITYNYTTGMFTFIYNDPSEDTSSMRFEVTRITGSDALTICNDTSAGFTGVMVCNTSMYTGYKKAVAYRTASPSIIIAEKIVNEVNEIFNSGFGLFISVFLWLAIVLSGFGNNPIWTVILAIVGLIPALMMGAINVAIFTGIAVLGALIIHFIKRAVAR